MAIPLRVSDCPVPERGLMGQTKTTGRQKKKKKEGRRKDPEKSCFTGGAQRRVTQDFMIMKPQPKVPMSRRRHRQRDAVNVLPSSNWFRDTTRFFSKSRACFHSCFSMDIVRILCMDMDSVPPSASGRRPLAPPPRSPCLGQREARRGSGKSQWPSQGRET